MQSIEALKRTETLDAKEKALQAKEAELRRWEADLRATGGLKPKKNWPNRFCPIVHHDIAAEVSSNTLHCQSFHDLDNKVKLWPMQCNSTNMLVSKQTWHDLTHDGTCYCIVTIGLNLDHMSVNRSLLQLSDLSQPCEGGLQQADHTVCLMLVHIARSTQVPSCIPNGTASRLFTS